jgi:hypothetical protein
MMRSIPLLLIGAGLVSCTTAPPPPGGAAQNQDRLQRLIAGKVAGTPQSCISNITTRSNNMVVIDDQTVAFRAAGGRVYVGHLSPGCSNIGMGNSLVTRQSAASSLCRGDIAQLRNFSSGATVGSCTFQEFIPYSPAGT